MISVLNSALGETVLRLRRGLNRIAVRLRLLLKLTGFRFELGDLIRRVAGSGRN